MKVQRAIVFGVFDRLHPGHLAFLSQARATAGEIVAVIARDAAVIRLKHKRPHESQEARIRSVRSTGLVAKAVLGDSREGEYRAMARFAPDAIILGYDQNLLAKDIRKKIKDGSLPPVLFIRAKPYRPEKFHTRLLTT